MKSERSTKDRAALSRFHCKHNVVELFHHNAALEGAQIAAVAFAIRITVGYRRERLSVFQCGERRLDAGARIHFRVSLVHVLDNVRGMYGLGPLEILALGIVEPHDFVFGWFRQRTHQITHGALQTQLRLNLP